MLNLANTTNMLIGDGFIITSLYDDPQSVTHHILDDVH